MRRLRARSAAGDRKIGGLPRWRRRRARARLIRERLAPTPYPAAPAVRRQGGPVQLALRAPGFDVRIAQARQPVSGTCTCSARFLRQAQVLQAQRQLEAGRLEALFRRWPPITLVPARRMRWTWPSPGRPPCPRRNRAPGATALAPHGAPIMKFTASLTALACSGRSPKYQVLRPIASNNGCTASSARASPAARILSWPASAVDPAQHRRRHAATPRSPCNRAS